MSSSPASSPSAAALPPSSATPPPSSATPPPPTASPPPPSASPPPTLPPPSVASAPSPTSSSSPPPPSVSSPPPPITSISSPPPSDSSPSPPPPLSSSSSSSPPPPPPADSPPSAVSSSAPPPPPPISTQSSPSTPSSPSPSSSSSSISTTALVGVGIAGLLAVSFILFLIYCCSCGKKKRKPGYNGPPGGLPAHAIYKDSYYGPNPSSEWGGSSTTNSGDSIFRKPPPPPPPPPLPKAAVSSPKHGFEYDTSSGSAAGGFINSNSKSWFAYEELEAATGGFSRANKLGEGGFGCVFKGTLPDGQLVAVKQLKAGASQGEKEFQAEVEIISRVHHRHLVSLVGYCISRNQRLLVYDYVPNGTLEFHLHKNRGRSRLDWPTRLKIARGAARGLAYLHEDCHPRIIHRDIKSSNILLDDKFEAQVSDFGLAKLSSDTNTHISTRVMGTFGYLAPEYASSGKLTEKSDVFSFGVVLLELLTGRKPVDASQPVGEESLVEWARPILGQIGSEADLDMIVDPDLNGAYDPKQMLYMVEAAAACVRHSANRRPSMGQIVRALEAETSDLYGGLRPGHSQPFGSLSTSMDYDQNGTSYSVEMRKFTKLAMGSREFGSEVSGEDRVHLNSNMMSSSEYQSGMTTREMQSSPVASASVSSSSGDHSKERTGNQEHNIVNQQQRPPNSVRKNFNSRPEYVGGL